MLLQCGSHHILAKAMHIFVRADGFAKIPGGACFSANLWLPVQFARHMMAARKQLRYDECCRQRANAPTLSMLHCSSFLP
jgi:hypothetical protein